MSQCTPTQHNNKKKRKKCEREGSGATLLKNWKKKFVLELGGISLSTLFLFQVVLVTLCYLHLHTNFGIILSTSTEKSIGILIRIGRKLTSFNIYFPDYVVYLLYLKTCYDMKLLSKA
jgi:hypothetical protein